jgi:hypothetical protein
MNINNSDTILKALIKLKYYNINIEAELNKFKLDKLLIKIRNELENNWDSSIRNKTLNEIFTNETSPELINRIERADTLSVYLTKDDTLDFYNSLSIDELVYLGY